LSHHGGGVSCVTVDASAHDVWLYRGILPVSFADKPALLAADQFSDAAGDFMIEPPTIAEGLDLVGILSAVRETAYSWDLATDRIDWESNAVAVIGVPNLASIANGTAYQSLIAPEHVGQRHREITGAKSDPSARGIGYRIQYQLLPAGHRNTISIWVEDHGRWWPDAEGRPVHARGVLRVITDRHWEEQRLLHRSDHDELTGQLNRIRLTEALTATIGRSERDGKPFAFLMASVNNLDVINESFGFDVGDEVIASTARLIKSKLRGGDTIGRYSSNKFGVILNDCGPGAMRIAAERFLKCVRDATIKTTACQLSASISIGGLVMPSQAMTAAEALGNAMHALDRAKMKRFDCFMPYEPAHSRENTRRRSIAIADDVLSALDEERMLLVLQPIISAKTGEAEHYECLLRMRKPDGGLVSAGEFMTVAEQLGLARHIDRRTLELCVALLKKHQDLRLALNVSGLTVADHEWFSALQRLTASKTSITNRLTIEITETAVIHDLDQIIIFVDTLRELGCRVAIDDFGAGYTSFKNLKVLNVDMVKIDGSFVKDLASDSSGEVFIRTMIEIAQTFGMETVAEWVGNQETADFLKNSGITYLQGFHYGMPMLVEDYERGKLTQ
jgi:diguanylate cyclase (GGDEF)-like protein